MAEEAGAVHAFDDIPLSEVAQALQKPDNHGDQHTDPEACEIHEVGIEEAVAEWRVARALDTLLAQINALAPRRNKASDGGIGDAAHATRDSDHNPWVTDGHIGVVTARDFTHDPAGRCDGTALAEGLRASRDARIKYIIWNRRICASQPMGGQPAWAWRPYTGTNAHQHHVHLSVKPDKPSYDSVTPWALASVAPGAASAPVAAPFPAATPDRNVEIAAIDAATQRLLGLVPLVERLTHLQDSPDPAVAGEAAALLTRYNALSRQELATQPVAAPQPDAPVQPSPPAPLPPFTGTTFVALKPRYEALYAGATVRPEWASQVVWHRQKLLQYRPRYDPVAAATAVPWWFLGIVHALEGSFNFSTHLHNGDPLTARTVHEPKNRPEVWNPPSDWASSAIDAIGIKGFAHQGDWTLARALFRFESYNGFSYYEKGINSPYLWSFSNQYSKGKFIADHVYDADTVSKQCGAAVMLKALIDARDVTL
jgi:lysozyme family protein